MDIEFIKDCGVYKKGFKRSFNIQLAKDLIKQGFAKKSVKQVKK